MGRKDTPAPFADAPMHSGIFVDCISPERKKSIFRFGRKQVDVGNARRDQPDQRLLVLLLRRAVQFGPQSDPQNHQPHHPPDPRQTHPISGLKWIPDPESFLPSTIRKRDNMFCLRFAHRKSELFC